MTLLILVFAAVGLAGSLAGDDLTWAVGTCIAAFFYGVNRVVAAIRGSA